MRLREPPTMDVRGTSPGPSALIRAIQALPVRTRRCKPRPDPHAARKGWPRGPMGRHRRHDIRAEAVPSGVWRSLGKLQSAAAAAAAPALAVASSRDASQKQQHQQQQQGTNPAGRRGGRGVVARLSRRNPCDGRAAEIGFSTPDFWCQNSGLGSSCHDARDSPIHSGQEAPQSAPRPKACEHKPNSKTGLACVARRPDPDRDRVAS